jgi:peptidoglycan/xylan/chitin deacetylase (PgdA/CDA1 family)
VWCLAFLLVLSAAGCAATRVPVTLAAQTGAATLGLPPNKLLPAQALALLEADRDPFWMRAREEVHRSVLELIAQNQDELRQGLRYSKLIRGLPDRKEIALTFDDGPHPWYTPKLLAVLKRYGVKATFFLVGKMAEQHPQLVRAEVAAGHSIGNHTYHHVSLVRIPDDDVVAEIKSCGQVLRAITGRAPRWFRPPGGEYDPGVAESSEALGYTMVLWTDDPGDYAFPGERVILSRTLERAANGGILLLHDGVQQTLDVLPRILEQLQARGYRFVTIDEMAAARRSRFARRSSA